MECMEEFFKSIIDQDNCAVVVCDTEHKIVYMNPAAINHYAKYGGASILGQSLLHCHNDKSVEMIQKVVGWFRESQTNNRVHTFYNEKQNKDVYMIALRDKEKNLIGYYEEHEFRNRDNTPFYDLR